MPKKVKQSEVYEDVEEVELMEEVPEPEIKISKRTGKPVRPMTAKQMDNLNKGSKWQFREGKKWWKV